jgi:hypothetical protein
MAKKIKIHYTVVIVFISFLIPGNNALASSGDNVSGWAWSPNIGWISLNCTTGGTFSGDICDQSDYGVSFRDGIWSGYAWSTTLGWISFNEVDTTACNSLEEAPFARVLSASFDGEINSASYTDSFDGCISLKNISKGSPVAQGPVSDFKKFMTQLVQNSTKKVYAQCPSWGCGGTPTPTGPGSPRISNVCFRLNGDAWGSHVVGWVSAAHARVCTITSDDFSLQVNPDRFIGNDPENTILSYVANPASSYFTSCTAQVKDESNDTILLNDWSGQVSVPINTPTSLTVPVLQSATDLNPTPRLVSTYSLSCLRRDGTSATHFVRVYRYKQGDPIDTCTVNPETIGCSRRGAREPGKGAYKED